jgi:hypothetical protein
MAFPIRTTLIAAAIVAMTAASHAADAPNLNVDRACHDAAKANTDLQFDADRCLKSEHEARDQLARQWADFPPADQLLCTQTATMGGTASYVQLITCLELKRAAAKLPPDGGLTTQPSSLQRKP